MTPGQNQTTAGSGAGIEIVSMPAELDLTTSEGVAAQGYAAIDRLARLVLLDLTGLSFCDARGLSAFVRIANHADAAGCGFGLIAPRPPAAKILRISGLDSRLPVFATIDDARAPRTATAGVWAAGTRRPTGRHIGQADVAFTTTQYVQTDPEADHQVANTLAELIISGSPARSGSRTWRVTAALMSCVSNLRQQTTPRGPAFSAEAARASPGYEAPRRRRRSRGGGARVLADRPLNLRLPGPGSL